MDKNYSQDRMQKLIDETEKTFSSDKKEIVIKRISELKTKGNVAILPSILNLLKTSKSDEVVKEILLLLDDIKDPKSVPVIIDFIKKNSRTQELSGIISSCWQSGLDYSKYLETFIASFINGDYQVALESFTVIEENIWRSSKVSIDAYITLLNSRKEEINLDKKLLYKELIKVLDSGKSKNIEEYP